MSLCLAIVERRLVTFTYNGHHREVIPAAHGSHATTGNPVLRGYQVGGTSSSRSVPLWDMFRLDRMTELTVSEATFGENPPDYAVDDQNIRPICCQL